MSSKIYGSRFKKNELIKRSGLKEPIVYKSIPNCFNFSLKKTEKAKTILGKIRHEQTGNAYTFIS